MRAKLTKAEEAAFEDLSKRAQEALGLVEKAAEEKLAAEQAALAYLCRGYDLITKHRRAVLELQVAQSQLLPFLRQSPCKRTPWRLAPITLTIRRIALFLQVHDIASFMQVSKRLHQEFDIHVNPEADTLWEQLTLDRLDFFLPINLPIHSSWFITFRDRYVHIAHNNRGANEDAVRSRGITVPPEQNAMPVPRVVRTATVSQTVLEGLCRALATIVRTTSASLRPTVKDLGNFLLENNVLLTASQAKVLFDAVVGLPWMEVEARSGYTHRGQLVRTIDSFTQGKSVWEQNDGQDGCYWINRTFPKDSVESSCKHMTEDYEKVIYRHVAAQTRASATVMQLVFAVNIAKKKHGDAKGVARLNPDVMRMVLTFLMPTRADTSMVQWRTGHGSDWINS